LEVDFFFTLGLSGDDSDEEGDERFLEVDFLLLAAPPTLRFLFCSSSCRRPLLMDAFGFSEDGSDGEGNERFLVGELFFAFGLSGVDSDEVLCLLLLDAFVFSGDGSDGEGNERFLEGDLFFALGLSRDDSGKVLCVLLLDAFGFSGDGSDEGDERFSRAETLSHLAVWTATSSVFFPFF
jgi:hypothetical protein